MKKTFGKEIEDETAKLESYRQLKPPPPAAAPTPPPVPTAEGPGGAGNAVPAVVAGQSPSGKLPARKQSPSQVPPQGQNANPGQPAAGRTTTQPVAAIKPPPAPARPQPVTGPPPVSRPAPATGPHPVSRPAPATGPHPVLRPAPVTGPPPTVARSAPVTGPQPTVARSAAVTGPHPVSRSAPVAVMPPSVPVPAPPPGPSASIGSGVAAMAAMPLPAPAGEPQRYQRPVELGWEDDELETRVYDDKEDPRNKSGRANLPLQPPVSSSPSIPLPTEIGLRSAAPAPGELPGWGSAAPPVESFPVAPQSGAGSGGYRNGASAAPAFSVGANELGTPPPDLAELAMPSRREPPRGGGPTFGADMPTIPVTSFGARITGRRPSGAPNRLVMAAVGGAAIIAVVAVLVIALSGGKPTTQSGPTVQVKAPPPLPPPDPSTGFDLYVAPAGITQWKLDGESRTDRLPSRIRGISPGPHTVQIEPPPGFLSQHQEVMVEAGKAPKVEIALQPIPGMSGVFESEPAGAMVSLIIDGKRQTLGPSPATSPLDPRNGYQVLFEKPGYVSINRPITFSAALEQHIVVNLEKVAPGTPTTAAPAQSPAPHAAPPEPRQRRAGRSDADSSDAGDAAERGAKQGVLVLGSKPPCDIAIDGSSTGLHTPQKEIKLPVGRHRITLSNPEFSINETFTVDIKADAPEKLIKDYSDRLP
jgi:hypothetical protein